MAVGIQRDTVGFICFAIDIVSSSACIHTKQFLLFINRFNFNPFASLVAFSVTGHANRESVRLYIILINRILTYFFRPNWMSVWVICGADTVSGKELGRAVCFSALKTGPAAPGIRSAEAAKISDLEKRFFIIFPPIISLEVFS